MRPAKITELLVVFHQSLVHHGKPYRWQQGHEQAGRIAYRQLRAFVHVPQDLVFAGSLVMVVAVAGQLEKHDASQLVVAVPGVLGQHLFGPPAREHLPAQPAYGKSVFHQFTIRHPRRDALLEHLAKHEIGTELIYPVPLHLQKCYASLGYGLGAFPVSELTASTCVSLPIFPELTDAQVDHVIASLNAF